MITGTQSLILFSVFRSPQIFNTWFRLLLTADLFCYTCPCRHGEGYTWDWTSLCPPKERGCSGMRSSSWICSSCTLIWCQPGGRKIDLGIGRKSCVHHWEIQFSGWKWKICLTVRAADLSLAAVIDSQNGWGWKGSPDVILSNPPAQAGPSRTGYPGPCPTGFWLSPSMNSPQHLWATSSSVWSLVLFGEKKWKKSCFLIFK